MTDPKQLEIQSWLRKAREDLESAVWLMESPVPFYNAIGFHCQQAAEKAIKAYLTSKDTQFGRTHSLVALVGMCLELDREFSHLRDAAVILTPYAVSTRYPGDLPEISKIEAIEAIEYSKKVYQFIVDHLN